MVRDFRYEPITTEELRDCYWFVMANDTIGGWDITNVPVPDSLRDYRKGEYEIGSFLTEKVADHIVATHNKWYQNEVYGTYVENITLSAINVILREMIDDCTEKSEKQYWTEQLLTDISQLPEAPHVLPF